MQSSMHANAQTLRLDAEIKSTNFATPLPVCDTQRVAIKAGPADRGFRVLILKADRLYSEMLRGAIQLAILGASIALAGSLEDACRAIADDPIDLLVTGVVVRDGDVLDVLPEWLNGRKHVRNAFVITERKEPHTLHQLSKLPLVGVFDQLSEGLSDLDRAVKMVSMGTAYWSRSVIDAIAMHCLPPTSVCRRLTEAEKRVFAAIGDGSDDATAAERLGLKESTIASVRRALHRKLGVQHKGELLRLAIQLGFVRIPSCDRFDEVPSNSTYTAIAAAQIAAQKSA